MSGRYTPEQGATAYWLLDLTWAGRTWRIADSSVVVVDADGDSLVYFAGLDEVDVSEDLADPADGTASSLSVSLDVMFPGGVTELVALGHDLSSARGQLSRWVSGTTHEKRRVVIDGIVEDPEHGEAHESVGLTLEMAPWLEESEIPAASQAVIGANFNDAMILSLAADEFGLAYPIIYGRPGVVDTSIASAGWVTGSEAVWVDHQNTPDGAKAHRGDLSMVIAGHHVSATTVWLNNGDFTEGKRFLVRNTFDNVGQPIAVIGWWYSKASTDDEWTYSVTGTYTYSAAPVYALGAATSLTDPSYHVDDLVYRRFYVGWLDAADTTAGGKLGENGTLIRNAADVIADLLALSGADVDRGRFATAAQLLSRFNLDFQISERVKPWTFLQSSVLPLLPLSLYTGPEGIAPIVWRYGARAAEAVARLDTTIDPTLERITKVTTDRTKVVNDISVNYAKSVRTGEYCAIARVRGDYVAGADGATGYLDPYCAASQRRYRTKKNTPLVVSKSIDASVIYDTTSAIAVAQWYAAAFALARSWVDYEGSEREYGFLERGSIVTLTDALMGYADVVCIVTGLRVVTGGRLRMRLLMQFDPARDLVRA